MPKKRVNPNRIPLKTPINADQLMREISENNMYHAWLLILPILLKRDGTTVESVLRDWEKANDFILELSGEGVDRAISQASFMLGTKTPYPDLDVSRIRTQADLNSVKQKLRRNSMHSSLCLAARGLQFSGNYSQDELKSIVFNADLTLAEIESGVMTYEKLDEQLKEQGIAL